ncbi:hypothetical protein RJ640_002518 [Escallonia rubra]|uniref:Stalled ribosome sensor GCN1-like N-terminal domain-containing protein n=1 Tax=Escallonia rubra TaxID=112253 RepID=A0AA88UWL7_9ASTE|nr:hypothetical protein RJ640_002518 [Escallonia rubra]
MADSLESLASLSALVSTPSTKARIQLFRHDIPSILDGTEMSTEFALVLVDLIFKTLSIYDDRGSRKAVDDVIVEALSKDAFMKSFAATLVQVMEKQLRFQSHVGCYRLLKWSCLLLNKSQFSSVSKNALCRVAAVQASVLHIVMQRSFRERRACKRTFIHLFSESPDIYKTYIEELKEARVPYKDCPELIWFILEYSSAVPSLFDQWKPVFLDMYIKAVLNARDKPEKALSEAFRPLFSHLVHEDCTRILIPSSVKVLKRNPELVLDSVGVLLETVNLDLSKYAVEILSVVLPQARHADDGRRMAALAIVGCLSQKSSNPDAVEAMFNAIKTVIGGSEGRLAFPYQRVGMIHAIQKLSSAPDGKHLNSLSQNICSFLLSCYKDDGNEEVKIAVLSALASWVARSPDAIQPDVVSFMASGLKEKEALRRSHLRCLRVICKKADAVIRIQSLVVPLVHLVKTGFTKAAQRLDGIYALLAISKIAAVDIKAVCNSVGKVVKGRASKLSTEDCMACLDLLVVLLVDHPHRVLETLPLKSLSQLILYFLCHPSWDIRKAASDSTKRFLAAAPQISEALLLEFSNYLSVVEEKVVLLKTSETENAMDAQVPFIPPVEVLVKALVVISSAVMAVAPNACTRIIFCSHHPCLVGTAKRNAVWRVDGALFLPTMKFSPVDFGNGASPPTRLQKCLQKLGFDVIGLLVANLSNLCKDLLGPMGLMSPNPLEQEAAIHSLSTLMSITPADAYIEFEKHLNNLPDRYQHDKLSQNDIQIFRTPEGMLSSEQGVYVAESVAMNNTKQAKGRFRVYENNGSTDHVSSNHSVRREPVNREAANVGKKDTGKSTKKAGNFALDKGKTAKEEARELQLRDEACVRKKVGVIQRNLSLMLRALGEMAIANPVFAHSQLPSLARCLLIELFALSLPVV